MKIIIFLYLFLSVTVRADSIIFGGLSTHLVNKETNTWFHRTLLYQKDALTIGYLKNSYGQDSWLVAGEIYSYNIDTIEAKLHLGIVRGYDRCYGKFEEGRVGKKAIACGLPILSITLLTESKIQPQLSLWGDAVVWTGKYNF